MKKRMLVLLLALVMTLSLLPFGAAAYGDERTICMGETVSIEFSATTEPRFYRIGSTDTSSIHFTRTGYSSIVDGAGAHYVFRYDITVDQPDTYVIEIETGSGSPSRLTINAYEHNWGEWQVTTEPTCARTGTETRTCSRNSSHRQTRTVAALPHEIVKVEAVTPACTEAGNIEHYACANCGQCFSDAAGRNPVSQDAVTLPATGHAWGEWEAVTAPTCTEKGSEKRVCATDATHVETREVAPAHKLVKTEAVAADCTKEGNIEYYTCSACSKLFSDAGGKKEITKADTVTQKTDHTWGEWKVTKAATETEEGAETRTCSVCKETETRAVEKLKPGSGTEVKNPFVDVEKDQYYFDPVLWAVNHDPQITKGMDETHFQPNTTCTRAQVVTFLWRAKGEPMPKTQANPYMDVSKTDYFYNAVLWAMENGITLGTSASTFSPNDPCTRAHVVTFLWRAEGKPEATGKIPFEDIPAGEYFTDAVSWAVNHNPQITNGMDETHFEPNTACTRGQIVTFLYRDMGK